MHDIDYSLLPDHGRAPMQNWIEHGIEGGSFLNAVVSNDLLYAFLRADPINKRELYKYVEFLVTQAPFGCFGNPYKVAKWKGVIPEPITP